MVQAGLGEMRECDRARVCYWKWFCARLLLPSAATPDGTVQPGQRIETRLDMPIPAPQAVPLRRLRLPSRNTSARAANQDGAGPTPASKPDPAVAAVPVRVADGARQGAPAQPYHQ